jgi:hypothetical protein
MTTFLSETRIRGFSLSVSVIFDAATFGLITEACGGQQASWQGGEPVL